MTAVLKHTLVNIGGPSLHFARSHINIFLISWSKVTLEGPK